MSQHAGTHTASTVGLLCLIPLWHQRTLRSRCAMPKMLNESFFYMVINQISVLFSWNSHSIFGSKCSLEFGFFFSCVKQLVAISLWVSSSLYSACTISEKSYTDSITTYTQVTWLLLAFCSNLISKNLCKPETSALLLELGIRKMFWFLMSSKCREWP